MACISLVLLICLKPQKQKFTSLTKASGRSTHINNDTLEEAPPPGEVKEFVQKAMAMLHVLMLYLTADGAVFSWNWRKVANTLMVG